MSRYAQLCLKISTKSLGDLGAKAEAPTTPDGKADPAAQPKKGSQFTRLLLTRCQVRCAASYTTMQHTQREICVYRRSDMQTQGMQTPQTYRSNLH